jgi:hypothetical protein
MLLDTCRVVFLTSCLAYLIFSRVGLLVQRKYPFIFILACTVWKKLIKINLSITKKCLFRALLLGQSEEASKNCMKQTARRVLLNARK